MKMTSQNLLSFTALPRLLLILGIILLSGVALKAAPSTATVFAVSGTVEFKVPGGFSFAPLKKGAILAIGTTIRTGEDGTATLVTTPGSAIQIGHDSNLKLNDLAYGANGKTVTERKAVMTLNEGVVTALIDPKTPKITDFKIQTPQGAAAARGTYYAVLVMKGKTYIGVKEGKVAATSR